MAKIRVKLSSPERETLRGAPQAVRELSQQIDKATPAQIMAAINNMTLADAKLAVYVLTLRSRDHERRLRALERGG